MRYDMILKCFGIFALKVF
ncbi:hypothetical protein RO1_03730 [Roseburia intestinalis XB6B4]|uniref:Uncharacterized protein n=1 Tax=Roseburia intestinalis XB6B4 TaxID=718255 RepID=D4KUW1_9FIRM|nr:hypothetical protein RO1_03730 [Roseburia intestinalis XB6B4]